ncbi:DUF4393 domain-containing protein [Bacillus sp. REN10]|uniref:DUF4393 domain-containing protein n=1 Tax=Bacillus sp. REN10 TaxID=2782541 RepID=UPI00193C04B9|nr:DUF4393 domain-containing protein [Bacillus sp. REN10]
MEINIIPKFVDEAVSPVAQSVGKTLSDIWNLGIGSHVALWGQKQEVRQQQNLQDYVKKVEEKTQKIPEEFLQEPPLHIVGPAIEASKYYIESEDLRELFANLIASSVDQRKSPSTHPSFVEVIKQMSPVDARNFKFLKDNIGLGIGSIDILYKGSGGSASYVKNFFPFPDLSLDNYELHSASVDNLKRLALIVTDTKMHFSDKSVYEPLKNHEVINKLRETHKREQSSNPHLLNTELLLKKNYWFLSDFGENFATCCFD